MFGGVEDRVRGGSVGWASLGVVKECSEVGSVGVPWLGSCGGVA